MRRDHEAALYAALDKLYLQGSVAILWVDLYLWYNADRLNKSAYRDITDQWKAVCEHYGHDEDDTPELEEIKYSDTWFLLTRKLFAEEERVPLSARTD